MIDSKVLLDEARECYKATTEISNLTLVGLYSKIKELEANLASCQESLRKYEEGYQGSCMCCEPVGLLNQQLQAERDDFEYRYHLEAGKVQKLKRENADIRSCILRLSEAEAVLSDQNTNLINENRELRLTGDRLMESHTVQHEKIVSQAFRLTEAERLLRWSGQNVHGKLGDSITAFLDEPAKTPCPECGGRGWRLKRKLGENFRRTECSTCHGTGIEGDTQ